MDIPILSLLVIIPLIGALATLFMGGQRAEKAKYVAVAFSAIVLALALYVTFVGYNNMADLADLKESYVWFKAAGLQMNIIRRI